VSRLKSTGEEKMKKIFLIAFIVCFTISFNTITHAAEFCGKQGEAISEYIQDKWHFSESGAILSSSEEGKSGETVYIGSACKSHDDCYSSPNADKRTCDKAFLEDMLKACKSSFSTLSRRARMRAKGLCVLKAQGYFQAVQLWADDAFNQTQSYQMDYSELVKKRNEHIVRNLSAPQNRDYAEIVAYINCFRNFAQMQESTITSTTRIENSGFNQDGISLMHSLETENFHIKSITVIHNLEVIDDYVSLSFTMNPDDFDDISRSYLLEVKNGYLTINQEKTSRYGLDVDEIKSNVVDGALSGLFNLSFSIYKFHTFNYFSQTMVTM
jgi:hypothetical protein